MRATRDPGRPTARPGGVRVDSRVPRSATGRGPPRRRETQPEIERAAGEARAGVDALTLAHEPVDGG